MSETLNPGFRIIALHQEGFKRIKLVDITPPRHLVKITGKNEQGKSSLMDGIGATLDGGSRFLQAVPIQVGKNKSVLKLTIGNDDKVEMIVTKTIRPKEDGTFSTTLVVENADGYRTPSPQKMLETYLGALTFDPGAFMRMKAEGQFDQIAGMVPGVDFSDIAKKNASDYARRTEVNRDAKRARSAAESVLVPDSIDAETQPVDEVALTTELAGAGKHNASIETRKERRGSVQKEIDGGPATLAALEQSINDLIKASQDRATADVADAEATIGRLEEEIATWRAKIIAINKSAEGREAQYAANGSISIDAERKHIASLQDTLNNAEPLPEPIDTEELTTRITEARNTNAAIRLRDQRAAHITEAEAHEADADRLTKAMEARDKAKEEAIAAAKLPVPGLSLGQDAKGEGVVLLDGLPLAQASHARKLSTSARIAMAMNTKLRVMLIQEAAFLDEDNMEILSQLAIENDYQIFVERVDSSGKVGFVIEDGHIAGVEVPPDEPEPEMKKARKPRAAAPAEDLF